MEAKLEDNLFINTVANPICIACVKCAQEEFFREIKKPEFLPPDDQNLANSLAKVRRNTHLSKWVVLWRCILHSYSNYCKVHYSVPPSLKRPALVPKTDNQQWKMDAVEQKIRSNKNLPIVSTYVRNISKLKLANWSPTVSVCDVTVKKPLKRINKGVKVVKKRKKRNLIHGNVRVASSVLRIDPNIIRNVPYVKLEDCLAPAKPATVVVKESFMNYFNLTSSKSESPQTNIKTKLSNKSLRYNSIPISSNLGLLLVNNTHSEEQALVRIKRTERYLNVSSSSTSADTTEYPITYNAKKNNCSHTYKFPKRQHHHQRLSLKTYAQLEVCTPVKVIIKRMNIEKYLHKFVNSNKN